MHTARTLTCLLHSVLMARGQQRLVPKKDAALGQEVQGCALGRGTEKLLLRFKPQPAGRSSQVSPGRAHALRNGPAARRSALCLCGRVPGPPPPCAPRCPAAPIKAKPSHPPQAPASAHGAPLPRHAHRVSVSSSLSDSPLPSAAVAGTHALAHDAMVPVRGHSSRDVKWGRGSRVGGSREPPRREVARRRETRRRDGRRGPCGVGAGGAGQDD